MARLARIVIPGVAHHVTQRGNDRQDVFFTGDDRRVYLGLFCESARRNGVMLAAYCLMTNHIHLVLIPERAESLSRALGRTHLMYAQYVHKLHGRSGHFWQNRFYSCPMDDTHAQQAMAYVELNPVRAGMVKAAWDYPWSSARAHCGMPDKNGAGVTTGVCPKSTGMSPDGWKALLRELAASPNTLLPSLRLHTRTGRPLGSDTFLSKVETLIGRRVRPLPVGRQQGWRKKKGREDAICQKHK